MGLSRIFSDPGRTFSDPGLSLSRTDFAELGTESDFFRPGLSLSRTDLGGTWDRVGLSPRFLRVGVGVRMSPTICVGYSHCGTECERSGTCQQRVSDLVSTVGGCRVRRNLKRSSFTSPHPPAKVQPESGKSAQIKVQTPSIREIGAN